MSGPTDWILRYIKTYIFYDDDDDDDDADDDGDGDDDDDDISQAFYGLRSEASIETLYNNGLQSKYFYS